MKKENHIMIQIIYVVFEFQYLTRKNLSYLGDKYFTLTLMQFYLFFIYISNIYLI